MFTYYLLLSLEGSMLFLKTENCEIGGFDGAWRASPSRFQFSF